MFETFRKSLLKPPVIWLTGNHDSLEEQGFSSWYTYDVEFLQVGQQRISCLVSKRDKEDMRVNTTYHVLSSDVMVTYHIASWQDLP